MYAHGKGRHTYNHDIVLLCTTHCPPPAPVSPDPVRRRRLSGHVDRQQQLVCYRELHDIWVAVGNRIKLNSDLEPMAGMFRKLLSQLEPYREELINNS